MRLHEYITVEALKLLYNGNLVRGLQIAIRQKKLMNQPGVFQFLINLPYKIKKTKPKKNYLHNLYLRGITGTDKLKQPIVKFRYIIDFGLNFYKTINYCRAEFLEPMIVQICIF